MKQSEQKHAPGIVGAAVARIEDPPLVRGRGLFAADVSFARQLHMRVVRSPLAHARIKRVDAADALAAPGVVAVWTGEDLADMSPIDFRDDRVEKLVPHRQPLLARGRVRYVGEPMAVVFADDPYAAEDAADHVVIELDELPPVMSADDDPVEIDGLSTEPMIIEKGYGDLDAAFRDAHTIVEADVAIGRHSAVPLETRGAIARYDAARDLLELHGAAKVPHRNREQLAKILNRPLSSIHLFEGHVGGGFGVRGELYPEDVLVCLAALRLGRPIKWIEDRHEHFLAANHSRQQRHKLRAAVDKDGHILAHRRRLRARPGRLCAHPRRARGRPHRRHAARPLSRAGLSGARPLPAHQQDPGRDLSLARPLRKHVRARTPDGCDCAEARHRPHRAAPPQPDRQE